ncbi:hypothetical protein [Corynebacterium epidermidicanis]|uniref:Rossmann-like domain n=1 Tax=Corynebacterium epidermidicanis TaxID=1050174 RepID=A0A0G3GS73_9CORY|nr:hypothetical protein [Corynebacterium epidermidicanis]AKK03984.1 Rossmann-like domain [Corynebacterium epidermidicanis]
MMTKPRMRIGVIGHLDYQLADRLENAGHSVEWRVPWEAVAEFDCLLLAVSAEDLPDVVARLRGRVRQRQIVIHTCVELGARALRELGGVAIALHPIDDLCAVGAEDELSETVATLLVQEMELRPVMVPEGDRVALGAALRKVVEVKQSLANLEASFESDGAYALFVAARNSTTWGYY